jgi:hypothetical protein
MQCVHYNQKRPNTANTHTHTKVDSLSLSPISDGVQQHNKQLPKSVSILNCRRPFRQQGEEEIDAARESRSESRGGGFLSTR